ncbi:MAG: response regulator [Magnetococcales bacterium]|nr:response regulator [Magnetococcales bacterium]
MKKAESILVVEDSATQRVVLERLLREAGFTPLGAKNGLEGLELARTHIPRLVISDVAMPEMDGYQMCREIKRDQALANIPVMLLTGLDDPKEVIRGLSAGADHYLTKPFDPDDLLSRIRYLMEAPSDETDAGDEDGLKVNFAGEIHLIKATRRRTLNLLLSTYESAVRKNRELNQLQTELRLLNEQLEEKVLERTRDLEDANRARNTFISNLSHEWRTPMNAIIGMTDLVLMSELNADQQENLDIVRSAADSLMNLLNSLLDFARLETGSLKVENHPFALRESLKGFIQPFLERAEEKGLSFFYQVDPKVGDRLVGDVRRIREILSQLIGNAVKFTEAGGVRVEVSELESTLSEGTPPSDHLFLRFAVIDSGIGIVPERQALLFQQFTQGDGGTTRKYGGTGIGLSLAKRLAERLGGEVGYENQESGGSCFYLDISLEVADGEEADQLFADEVPLSPEELGSPLSHGSQEADPETLTLDTFPEAMEREIGRFLVAMEGGNPLATDLPAQWLKKCAGLFGDEALRREVLRMVLAARNSDRNKAREHLEGIVDWLQHYRNAKS